MPQQKPTRYYSMSVAGQEADIYIFGDIVNPVWQELDAMWGITSETSGYSLAKDLKALDAGVTQINVHINSYGGDVSEGLAIHNLLKQHAAKVVTIVDGFACSAASVVFMAGDERLMNNASLLMVHNAWSYASGNANDLRKAAEDLDVITQASINAYMARVSITEAEVKELLDNETWILPADAVSKGFATGVFDAVEAEPGKAAASARQSVMQRMIAAPVTVPAAADANAIADAVVVAMRAAVHTVEPPPPVAQENKVFKLLNALTKGGKEMLE